MITKNPVVSHKDYREYEGNLEPRDFTRIHDSDLRDILSLLLMCSNDYNHPYFTDRHGMGERLRKVLENSPSLSDLYPDKVDITPYE